MAQVGAMAADVGAEPANMSAEVERLVRGTGVQPGRYFQADAARPSPAWQCTVRSGSGLVAADQRMVSGKASVLGKIFVDTVVLLPGDPGRRPPYRRPATPRKERPSVSSRARNWSQGTWAAPFPEPGVHSLHVS